MPEPENENPYWQRIMDATFVDSLQSSYQSTSLFQEKFYWFLKAFALEIKALNKSEHPRLIDQSRFEEICKRTLPHAHYIDHAALHIGKNRMEKAVETAITQGFIPSDYFLPMDEKTGFISVAVGNHEQNLYFTMTEELDGWTRSAARRIQEFQKLLQGLFQNTKVPVPNIRIRSNSTTHEEFLIILEPDISEPLSIPIDDSAFVESPISASVRNRGEFLLSHTFDAQRIINPSFLTKISPLTNDPALLPEITTPRTIYELYKMLKMLDILPLVSEVVLSGVAGKNIRDRHAIKQFSTKELAYGWFLEFIERIGPNAKRGYILNNVRV